MDNKKAPGEDGNTGDIYNYTFKILPKSITAMYNGCLRHGVFPTRWKRAKLMPIIKPGKENNYEVSKYRPISLLNVGDKVLEKVIVSRINHHVYTNDYINKNQYVFTPQTSTIDAAMAVKDFVVEGFKTGKVATIISLDVEGAFNSEPKLTFRDHIIYMTEKCSKLIFALSKSAKLIRGLNHAALKIIYTGGYYPSSYM